MTFNELAHGQDACLNAKEIWQETISEKEKAEYTKAAHDPVNHPSHYTDRVPGIECIDVVENFDFCLGGAIKYIWRAGLKDPTKEIEDLRKARWLLDREIQRLEKEVSK